MSNRYDQFRVGLNRSQVAGFDLCLRDHHFDNPSEELNSFKVEASAKDTAQQRGCDREYITPRHAIEEINSKEKIPFPFRNQTGPRTGEKL